MLIPQHEADIVIHAREVASLYTENNPKSDISYLASAVIILSKQTKLLSDEIHKLTFREDMGR